MRTLSLNALHRLQYYSSILELTAARHLEYQLYTVLEAGVGSSEAAARRHEERAVLFGTRPGKERQQMLALCNAHYCRDFVAQSYAPRRLSFAALVASVDGVPTTDLMEEGLQALLERLVGYGLTEAQLAEALDAVQQAFTDELAEHFPARFEGQGAEVVQATHLRRRVVALCDYLSDADPQHLATVAEIDETLLDLNEPEVFETGDPDNALVQRRRAFAQVCGLLAEHGVLEPEQLTVFQFQSRVDFVTAKMKRTPRE